MMNTKTVIAKIDFLKNHPDIRLSEQHQRFLEKMRSELVEVDESKNIKIDLLVTNNQLYEIAKIYLGLEELEKWFPEEKKETKSKHPPAKPFV